MTVRATFIALGSLLCAALVTSSQPSFPNSATPSAAAAVSAPGLSSAGATTASGQSYPLGTVSFTSGRLYVAFVTLGDTGGNVDRTPGIVGGGTNWTQIDAGQASAGGFGMTAYSFLADADLANVDLQTQQLSTTHEGLWYSIVEVSDGVSVTEPIAQYAAGRAGPGTSYSRTLPSTPAADSLVLGGFTHVANEGSTPDAGWTEVAGSDLGHSSPPRGAHLIYDDSNPSATAGSHWSTSRARRGIVVEVSSDSGGGAGVTLVAAGDLCGGCAGTSARVLGVDPDFVVTMGDLAYTNGLLSEFNQKYGGGTTPQTRWGRPAIKDITLPGYGNHDCYDVPRDTGATKQGCDDAVTYFGPDTDFGTDIAGTPGSYYTVRGDWLVVHLNSAGDVGTGHATAAEVADQNTALEQILAADQHTCELVFWHHPRYSSGEHGNNTFVDPWYETAYAAGVDVVLNGHDHDYERFAPQDGDGNATANGIREIVVGTGGAAPRPFEAIQPHSLVQIVDKGILAMELNADSYSWRFLDDVTGATDDAGSGSCHT